MKSVVSCCPIEVIRLQGHVNAAVAAELRQNLTSAIASATGPALVVDMAQVESMDSAGLMALVSTLRLAQNLDRQLILCSISPSVRIIFELTQLDRVFKIFSNEAECETFILDAVA